MKLDGLEALRLKLRHRFNVVFRLLKKWRTGIGQNLLPGAAEKLVEREVGVFGCKVPKSNIHQRLRLWSRGKIEPAHPVPKRLPFKRSLSEQIWSHAAECFGDG